MKSLTILPPGGLSQRRAPARRELAVATLLSVATIAVAFAIGPRGYAYEHTWEYVKMIEGSPSDAAAPFAYRILVPIVLQQIPLPPKLGFFLISGLATLATIVGLFALFRSLGLGFRASLITSQLAGFSYPVSLYLAYWGMVDPAAHAFTVLALLGLARRRWTLASAALCLGVVTKEAVLLLVPLLGVNLWKRGEKGTGARLVQGLLVLLPVAAFAGLRAAVHPMPGPWELRDWHDLMRLWQLTAQDVRTMGPHVLLAGVVLRSYGFTWIMALFGFRQQTVWRGTSVYLLLTGVVLCAVGADLSRMLGFGFVGILIPTAVFLEHLGSRRGTTQYLVPLVVLSILQCGITLAGLNMGMSAASIRLHRIATIACALAGTLTVVIAHRVVRRTSGSEQQG
ncbi:MAG: hypothetical protein AB1486_25240 [Planctomycetota bacterium]